MALNLTLDLTPAMSAVIRYGTRDLSRESEKTEPDSFCLLNLELLSIETDLYDESIDGETLKARLVVIALNGSTRRL